MNTAITMAAAEEIVQNSDSKLLAVTLLSASTGKISFGSHRVCQKTGYYKS